MIAQIEPQPKIEIEAEAEASSAKEVEHIYHLHPQRIRKEMEELAEYIKNTPKAEMEILQIESQIQYGIFVLHGPLQTPYEGYGFRVKVIWPEDYPYHPPKITFMDYIWNPFASQKGQICMDLLAEQFSPALVIRTFLLSISSLMAEYKLSGTSFLNPQAASQMITNYNYFFKIAKGYAQAKNYKKKELYNDEMRGLPQEMKILYYQNSQIQEAIKKDLEQNIIKKKEYSAIKAIKEKDPSI